MKVASKWGQHVSHNGFRVLTMMAVTALDKPKDGREPNMYFAGHKPLAMALKDSGTKSNAALQKAVSEAVRELIALGAIELVQAAKAQSYATYRLTLDSKPGIYKRDLTSLEKLIYQVETTVPAQVETTVPAQVETTVPAQVETTVPAPYKEEEPLEEQLEELEEEGRGSEVTNLALPRANPRDEKPPNSPPCRDPTCHMGYTLDNTKPPGQRNTRCPSCQPPNVIPFRKGKAQ